MKSSPLNKPAGHTRVRVRDLGSERHARRRQSDSVPHAVRPIQSYRTRTPLEIRAEKGVQPVEQSRVPQARPERQQEAEEGVGMRGEQQEEANKAQMPQHAPDQPKRRQENREDKRQRRQTKLSSKTRQLRLLAAEAEKALTSERLAEQEGLLKIQEAVQQRSSRQWKYPASEANRNYRMNAARTAKSAGVRRKAYFMQDYRHGTLSEATAARGRMMVAATSIILMVRYCLAGESIMGILPAMVQQAMLLTVEIVLAGGVTWKGCGWFIK